MRIALVNPWYDYGRKTRFRINRPWPPLDLAIAAALLEREGINVAVIDANAMQYSPELVADMVENYDKIFITSSPLDRWQCPDLDINSFIVTSRAIKAKGKQLFAMGSHGSMRPREILEMTGADAVIRGEPESVVLEICQKPMEEVRSITYMNNGNIVFNPTKPPMNPADIPMPAFHLLPMDKYYYEVLGRNFTLLEATRGCPYLCNFCAEDIMYGIQYRKKPLENVQKEILTVVNDYGVENIYFIDLEFTLDRHFVHQICDFLIENNIKVNWACQTRADTIDYDLLVKMKRAGCSLIHFGVESGSQKVLDSTKKDIKLEEIREGIKMTKEVGMEAACFILLGLPGETKEDMEQTIKFAKSLNADYVSFHIATPYPSTGLYESVKSELGNVVFPTSYNGIYSEQFLKHMKRRMFMQYYLRPNYVIRRLKKNPTMIPNQVKLFLSYL